MEQITVSKTYFEALLRRADFYTDEDPEGELHGDRVTIRQDEYRSLLRKRREYETLRRALLSGGVTEDTLELLVAEDDNEESNGHRLDRAPLARGPAHNTHGRSSSGLRLQRPRDTSYGFSRSDESTGLEAATSIESVELEETVYRTLYLSNLPGHTSYRDLVAVIRGGTLVGINLRPDAKHGGTHRAATVSFLYGAAEYLAWTKRNDLYLHSKRIEVKWADKQFHLNSHIKAKMDDCGATRNLLIGNAVARGITAQQIREDMEHIHKLNIVDIFFQNGNAYVSTNSVCNALYARTCMLSRIAYKGCRIEFMPDECAGPRPRPERMRSLSAQKKVERKVLPLANRFDLLSFDDNDETTEAEV